MMSVRSRTKGGNEAKTPSFRTLFTEAHRPFFAAGILFAIASIALWLLHLTSVLPYAAPYPQARLHMAQMLYFFLPFFIFGFLLSVFPRLLSVPPPSCGRILVLFCGLLAAALLFTVGLYGQGGLLQAAALLAAITNLSLSLEILAMLHRTGSRQRQVPGFICAGVAFSGPGALALMLYLSGGDEAWGLAAEDIGIYGFLLPTIYAVAYRMVPVFTAASGREVVRARYGLHFMLFFSLSRMALGLLDLHAAYGLPELGLFLTGGHQCWQWRIWRPKPHAVQSVLHWAMAWFPLSFLLASAFHLAEAVLGEEWLRLEQAALHALLIGGFGTLILGMATRLLPGRAGRTLLADPWLGRLFFAFQFVPLLRVGCGILSELWPPCMKGIEFSGLLWIAVFLLWALRYVPLSFKVKR